MRRRSLLPSLFLCLALPSPLMSTAMSWGTAEDWLPRCELAEVYLATALVDEPAGLSASDLEQAVLCTAFVEGYRLGTIVGDLEPLRRQHGDNIPNAAFDALVGTHCCDAASDEIIHGLVEYLRTVTKNRPEEEFDLALSNYSKESFPYPPPSAVQPEPKTRQ